MSLTGEWLVFSTIETRVENEYLDPSYVRVALAYEAARQGRLGAGHGQDRDRGTT